MCSLKLLSPLSFMLAIKLVISSQRFIALDFNDFLDHSCKKPPERLKALANILQKSEF